MSRAAERSFLVLDIETILDPELPLPQPLTEGSALPPAPFHQVVVVGVAYLDDQYLAQRFAQIQQWADYLDKLRKGADVIQLPTKAA